MLSSVSFPFSFMNSSFWGSLESGSGFERAEEEDVLRRRVLEQRKEKIDLLLKMIGFRV